MSEESTRDRREERRSLLLSGGTIGIGSGALLDVFVFHLVLQHHHILSGLYEPTTAQGFRTNVLLDGVFSTLMLCVLLTGVGLLWRTANRAERTLSTLRLVGAIVAGMGVFNLYDGVVDHYVLGIHDVVHGAETWNPHWVGVSVLLLALGGLILWVENRRQ